VPFGFRRRDPKKPDSTTVPGRAGSGSRGIPFEGLTEEWRLVGRMEIEGRLSDVLNRREAISISDVRWAPADGSSELTPAPGLERVDPFDLIAVFAGAGSLPSFTDAERAAHKLHKVSYDVALENRGRRKLTLSLALAPASGQATVSPDRVELAPGEHRRVFLVASASGLGPGPVVQAVLTATGPGGDTVRAQVPMFLPRTP
jgi:hypothetical protein